MTSIVERAFSKIERNYRRWRDRVQKNQLGSCGTGVSIRQPSVIECPEKVVIGNDVSIGSFLHIWGHAGVEIGDRTMIGSHVTITSLTHDPNSFEMHTTIIALPVTIENDVWIGSHSIIFPGVRIGAQSVIAAGSVVREPVPPGSIVAGVPAVVKRRKLQQFKQK